MKGDADPRHRQLTANMFALASVLASIEFILHLTLPSEHVAVVEPWLSLVLLALALTCGLYAVAGWRRTGH